MTYARSLRVSEMIHNELAQVLLREVKDPRVRHVVITKVEVSPDLRSARVSFSRYGEGRGEEAELEEGLQGLERAAGFLQAKLGQRLRLKRTPLLHFQVDRGAAHSDHIDRLLRDLRRGEETEGSG